MATALTLSTVTVITMLLRLTMATVMAIATGTTAIPHHRIDSRDGHTDPGLRVSITGIMMVMMMAIISESPDIIVIDDVCLPLPMYHVEMRY